MNLDILDNQIFGEMFEIIHNKGLIIVGQIICEIRINITSNLQFLEIN